MDSTASPKVKITERKGGVGAHSLGCNISRVKRRAEALG